VFLVTYGDSFLPVDFRAIYEAFDPSKDAALMTVFRNRGCWDTSNACFESGRVTLYDKSRKPNGPAELPNFEYIDYGLSALSRRTVADGLPAKERHDLADLFHRLSREGRLAGCEVATRFYEIGSPAGWQDFSEYVTNLPRSFGKEAETLDAAQDLSL
jgi:NDP-sugar pyrophosphorylase family protein